MRSGYPLPCHQESYHRPLRRKSDGRTSFSFEGYVKGPDGLRHKQKWTVHGLSGMDLPHEDDERVLMALMAVFAGEGFRSRTVPFRVYCLLKLMGLTAESVTSGPRMLKPPVFQLKDISLHNTI